MSEELLQTIPQKVGKYTYYRLGSTTLNQLKHNGIIPQKEYKKAGNKKPDGLIVYRTSVKAVVEYKLPKNLDTPTAVERAIAQEIDVARMLCKILIVTDGSQTFWINALNGETIKDSDGHDIMTLFHPAIVKNTSTIEYLLDEIDASLTQSNSTIRSATLIDPTPLATRLWQTIWVATGKSPVKCLYNVVELFIFKFLSDLNILPNDIAFSYIYQKALNNAEDALEFYARNTRSRMYRLFPPGNDGTTIINGTIFVTENGEPNLSQSILFLRSLEHLQRYSEEFGSLTKIDKQFKTRLFESFLKQEVQALGQYFTPRKIIQSIIRMSGIDDVQFQYRGKRFCDPFCGVGGFPLEILNMNEEMRASYTPDDNGSIHIDFVLHGFDKGFERDDERTIILAKANMLIYLAELLFKHPQCSNEFARMFNETFELYKDNLGTFGKIIQDESEKYDFIVSNPPYVTSGTSIIKEEIQKTPKTINEYPINALGLEGLSIEWIIKSLKRGGKTFVIIPDGILGRVGGKKLRNYILRECYLDAIISLPVRTFFANSEHTYILALTKKNAPQDVQQEPVFTYLVSNIGERLTSVKREEIVDNDLPEMEQLFRIFTGAKSKSANLLEQQSPRCKIQPISLFRESSHWVIDRWWSRSERLALDIEEGIDSASKQDVDAILVELTQALAEYEETVRQCNLDRGERIQVALGDTNLFTLFIGKRVRKKDLPSMIGPIPLYSANVFEPFGYVAQSNIQDFSYPAILWSIDGNFEFNLIAAGQVFATTDHCGTIQIRESSIVPDYLLYALKQQRVEETFDRSFRSSLANMRSFVVEIPVLQDGAFDRDRQQAIATQVTEIERTLKRVQEKKKEFDDLFGRYVSSIPLYQGDGSH